MKKLIPIFLLLTAAALFATDKVQVLSDPEIKTATEWKSFGGKTAKDESNILTLQKQETEKQKRCSWRANTVIPDKPLAGSFTLVFEAETTDIVPVNPDNAWAGAVVLIHGRKGGKHQNVKAERFDAKQEGFRKCTVKGVIPESMEALYVEFTLQNASGAVKLKNISMTMDSPENDKGSIK